MDETPRFPRFKPFEPADRPVIHPILGAYRPETSELTFTNLFAWGGPHRHRWCLDGDHLLVGVGDGLCALPPVGPPPRVEVTRRLLTWLSDEGAARPRIERADRRLVGELEGDGGFSITPDRDQFDYLYSREDLATLEGNRYHAKRNHINAFEREHPYEFVPLEGRLVVRALELANRWCSVRGCEDDLGLTGEYEAVVAVLSHYDALGLTGRAVLVGGRLAAFAVGEPLNPDTAVVHLEKADPGLRGLYPLINRLFCERLEGVKFVNREQDLGLVGLRRAKQSYHPLRLVEKYAVRLREP
jgi:hypothetical protein